MSAQNEKANAVFAGAYLLNGSGMGPQDALQRLRDTGFNGMADDIQRDIDAEVLKEHPDRKSGQQAIRDIAIQRLGHAEAIQTFGFHCGE